MRTLFIPGGAGFIGSHFIHYMHQAHPGDRIVCLDRLTYAGTLANLRPLESDPQFRFVRGDICDRPLVRALFQAENPDVVVNFAAESHVDRSIEDPEVFLRTNLLGIAVLLDACREYGVQRYHQVSTDEVYGDLPLDQSGLRFTEGTPLCPSSPYSASKAGADLLALAYCRTYGLPVTVSRCSNNYGPRQFPEKLIPLTILNALNSQPLPVYGDGRNRRDWLYVEDHCKALDRVLEKGRVGEVYNIGGGQELCNLEVVRQICRALGKPEGLISYVADRKGHDLRYAVDASKLQTELGWRPETPFSQGLQRTIDWYREHPHWWD